MPLASPGLMRKARALGKSGTNELVLAELIRQQRQIEAESRGLTKAERRTRERKGTLKGTNSAVSTTEGLRPIDTGYIAPIVQGGEMVN